MNVIRIAQHPDWPVPLELFLANGKYQQDYAALIQYDEVFFIMTVMLECLKPFQLPDAIPDSQPGSDTAMIQVKIEDLRKVQALLKNTSTQNG